MYEIKQKLIYICIYMDCVVWGDMFNVVTCVFVNSDELQYATKNNDNLTKLIKIKQKYLNNFYKLFEVILNYAGLL